MRNETDLNRVKWVAKQLVMIEPHLTEFSPVVVQHPFTSSGMVAIPSDEGIKHVDITKSPEELVSWQNYMKAQIDEAKSAYHIYMMTNKPYSMTFLKFAKPHLSQKDFSEILADAWIRSENPNLGKNFKQKELLQMFKDAAPHILMDKDEQKQLAELDDTVTVYRGVTTYNAKNIKALSWTLEQKTAEWFANRFGEDGTVYEAQIPKQHIYALLNGRGESEVIVDPKYLTDITEAPIMEEDITLKM